MFVRWTHAARSLLLVFAVPAFLAALFTRPARGASADASALWEAWPHTVEVSPLALKHEELRARLAALATRYPGLFSIAEEGVSAEGRNIPLLVVGGGPTTVLLWSQMHGDEPTATSALLDILEHLGRTQRTPDTGRLLSRLTLAIIPMLNPDGAARTRRTNAQGIDINRDALRLQTPEGRFLKSVRDRLKPSVGYNLHNHSPSVTAGKHGRQVAISLLSVPFDDAFTVNEGRRTTMRMAVLVQQLLEPWAKDRVARYDMDYTARAFGDSMTRWGTPTLLIESGGFFGPDEANTLVRLNFVALLGTLHALADGSLAKVDIKGLRRDSPQYARPPFRRPPPQRARHRRRRPPAVSRGCGPERRIRASRLLGLVSTRDARRRLRGGRPDGLSREDGDRPDGPAARRRSAGRRGRLEKGARRPRSPGTRHGRGRPHALRGRPFRRRRRPGSATPPPSRPATAGISSSFSRRARVASASSAGSRRSGPETSGERSSAQCC